MKAIISSVLLAAATLAATAAVAQERRALEVFRDCPDCPEMVALAPGSFVMGADGPNAQERPAHRVTIGRALAIGRYEVTFEEWQVCLAAGGCTVDPDDHKWGRERRPVINVAHGEAVRYTEWLSRHTGKAYRLPSEAEWEYAARAETTTEFWWGGEAGANRANCRDCGSEWSAKGSGPVGSFAPNPWGLHDTSGNVWEWVLDCWNPDHVGAPADGAPRLTGDCVNRVMRGGSWYYFSRNARSAWRWKNDGRVRSYGIGFRVARDLP